MGARDKRLNGRSPRQLASEHTKFPSLSVLSVGGAVEIGDSTAHNDCTPPMVELDVLMLLTVNLMLDDAPLGSTIVNEPDTGVGEVTDAPLPTTRVPSEKAASDAGDAAFPTCVKAPAAPSRLLTRISPALWRAPYTASDRGSLTKPQMS